MLKTLLDFYSICICMHVIHVKKKIKPYLLSEFMNPQVNIRQHLSNKYFV